MTSLNTHFTFHYSQPADYHFSHDSVFLARRCFEILRQQDFVGKHALDLCAGCGIVGLDFLVHCEREKRTLVQNFDFLEVQDVYLPHFQENLLRANISQTQTQFRVGNYADMSGTKEKYDLIISNPPYFRVGQGKLSPSEFKNRCRFFIDSDFRTLFESMAEALRDQGQAFFLLRDLSDHGVDAHAEAKKILLGRGNLLRLGDIRGTDFMLFKRDAR